MIRVCLAGATGWAGPELARAIARQPDLTLSAAVGRSHAGRRLGEVLGDPALDAPVYASAAHALAHECDVFLDYTSPDVAKAGMTDQRLSLRHDAGNSARPYVDGALLANRKVGSLAGLHRGLDTVLDL